MKNIFKLWLDLYLPINLHPIKKLLFKATMPITNRLLSHRDRHHGESCYIFGDGVSIKWFDLSAFPAKPAFTLAWLPYHKQAEKLNIKYGILSEPKFFYPYYKLPIPPKTWWRNRIQSKNRKLIKNHLDRDFFVNLSNYPVLRGNNIYFIFRSIADLDFEFLNECNAARQGIYDGSFRCAIALAIYMGFKEITLVGCDYTHETSRTQHWYEKGEGFLHPQPDYQRRYLEIAQKYAKITTITMEGGSNVLPAITYTEYTGRPLAFRENHELTDIEMLKLLDTWPGHTIF